MFNLQYIDPDLLTHRTPSWIYSIDYGSGVGSGVSVTQCRDVILSQYLDGQLKGSTLFVAGAISSIIPNHIKVLHEFEKRFKIPLTLWEHSSFTTLSNEAGIVTNLYSPFWFRDRLRFSFWTFVLRNLSALDSYFNIIDWAKLIPNDSSYLSHRLVENHVLAIGKKGPKYLAHSKLRGNSHYGFLEWASHHDYPYVRQHKTRNK